MRVAVTGGTGFLGGHLCEALLDQHHAVRTLVRSPAKATWLASRGCEVVPADVTDRQSLHEGLDGTDVLVANAAMGSGQGDLAAMRRVNVTGVQNSLQAAADVGIRRVILISTTAVYRTRLNTLIDESSQATDPYKRSWDWKDLTTDWRYAMTKTEGENLAWRLADELDLELTAIQPCPVYGPRDPKFTTRLLAALRRRRVFLPTAGIPMVHARDVADAVAQAVVRPHTSGHRYITAGPPASMAEVVRILSEHAGTGPRVIKLPVPLSIRYDTAAAERDLDFKNRPLQAGLHEVLDRAAKQAEAVAEGSKQGPLSR